MLYHDRALKDGLFDGKSSRGLWSPGGVRELRLVEEG